MRAAAQDFQKQLISGKLGKCGLCPGASGFPVPLVSSNRDKAIMFTWLNSQGVRSDLGFEVENIDRYSIAYREGAIRLDTLRDF